MKKIGFVCVLLTATVLGFGQQVRNLNRTIEAASSDLLKKLPPNTSALLLEISAPAGAEMLGSYISSGLRSKLVDTISLVDRSRAIDIEIQYQLSGNVDDAKVKGPGHQEGAEYVIWGKVESAGTTWRLTLNVTSVETAVLKDAPVYSISSNDTLKELTGEKAFDMDSELDRLEKKDENGRPKWVDEPKTYGMLKYEETRPFELSDYQYFRVQSTRATSESLARDIANRNTALQFTNLIAEEFKTTMNSKAKQFTVFGEDKLSIGEDVKTDVITKASSSAQARVPRYEELETSTERQKDGEGGRTWYIVYRLLRIPNAEVEKAILTVDTKAIEAAAAGAAKKARDENKITIDQYNTIVQTYNSTSLVNIRKRVVNQVETKGL
jgi:TolB-like protein